MKVRDLAQELNTTSDFILGALKSLKLKAKDEEQDLNIVVLSVLRTHLNTLPKPFPKLAKAAEVPPPVPPQVPQAEIEEPKEEIEETKKKPALKKTKKADAEIEAEKGEEVKEAPKKKTVSRAKKPADTSEPEIKEIKPLKEEKPLDELKKKQKEEPIKEEKPAVPAASVEEKKPSKKKIITDEPIITLKPFGRKKRREDEYAPHEMPEALGQETISQEEPKAVPSLPENLSEIEIPLPITVKDLSTRIQQKPSVILKDLMNMGLFCHINQVLDKELVEKVIEKYGFILAKAMTQEEVLVETHEKTEDPKSLKPRPPVVTLMGHVDHGKTSLLDRIRKSNVVDTEHGGITQHMRAYAVKTPKGIVAFLDTPGHEAFTSMRARGAHITDIVIIVIAADEGIMPQTLEAIDHARAAHVPIIIALNKMDKPNVNVDRVKKQLSEIDLTPEDWGGKTIVAPVSAKTGDGIDHLLEMVLLESEMLELKANPDRDASGIVVEAHLSQGKGAVATLMVQTGTLKEGDVLLAGPFYGRIKAMFDDYHKRVTEAGPSISVEVLGLPEVPEAGEKFYVVENERKARDIAVQRQEELKKERLNSKQRMTLETLYLQMQKGMKELNVILKADVQGSVEAIKDSLLKLPNDKVKLNFIHAGAGEINSSDIVLAKASDAVIIAFNVAIGSQAKAELEKEQIDLREYRIIYDVVEDVRKALEGMLEAKIVRSFLARIEVRQVFKLSRSGIVAGCHVQKGKATRKAKVEVLRNGESIFKGEISSLKRFKDDVKEVAENMECGVTIGGFDKYEPGDILEVYEEKKVAQRL